MNILVTNNHVIYNSHNPDIDHKKEPAKNPGDSDFFYRLCPVLSDDFCICVHVHNALCRASPISTLLLLWISGLCSLVSMPYIGLIPFLLYSKKSLLLSLTVSMPYIGLIPFLLEGKGKSTWTSPVSMPYIGLIPFLQYPLKNLIKSMVSGTVFRG